MEPGRLVLLDANVLINLAHVDRTGLLSVLANFHFGAPPEALVEVTSPRQRARVENALALGHLSEIPLAEPGDLALYAELREIMGSGEAACLALAVRRGALVASDEKRVFRREAERRLGAGRIFNTPGLLLLAIRRDGRGGG